MSVAGQAKGGSSTPGASTSTPVAGQKSNHEGSHGASCDALSKGDSLRKLDHERLGHLNPHALDRLIREGMVEGLPSDMPATGQYAEPCESCIMGKGTRLPFKPSQKAATRPLERVHVDTATMKSIPGVRGEQYSVTVLDEFSGWKKCCLFRPRPKSLGIEGVAVAPDE
jgi:hypothetical protein